MNICVAKVDAIRLLIPNLSVMKDILFSIGEARIINPRVARNDNWKDGSCNSMDGL